MEYSSKTKNYFCENLIKEINTNISTSLNIMIMCNKQNKKIREYGIDKALSDRIKLVNGPVSLNDILTETFIQSMENLSKIPDVILTAKSNMLYFKNKYNIKIVSNHLESIKIAEKNTDREIVFLSAGFEEEASITALILKHAMLKKINNFSMMISIKTIPELIRKINFSKKYSADGFLCSSNNAAILGKKSFEQIALERKTPISICRINNIDILLGILEIVKMVNSRNIRCCNLDADNVRENGNIKAHKLLYEVFKGYNTGSYKYNNMSIKKEYEKYDTLKKFNL